MSDGPLGLAVGVDGAAIACNGHTSAFEVWSVLALVLFAS